MTVRGRWEASGLLIETNIGPARSPLGTGGEMETPSPYGPSLVVTARSWTRRGTPSPPRSRRRSPADRWPRGYGSFDSTCTFKPPEITPFTWTMRRYRGNRRSRSYRGGRGPLGG